MYPGYTVGGTYPMVHPWVGTYTPWYTRGYEGYAGYTPPVGMRGMQAIHHPGIWERYPGYTPPGYMGEVHHPGYTPTLPPLVYHGVHPTVLAGSVVSIAGSVV